MKWERKTLDKLGEISRGRSRHRPRNDPSLYGGRYPFIQTSDVKNASFHISDYSQTYNDKGLAQSKLWHPGTLCITIAANIADTGILGIDACFPDSIMGFIPYENEADVRFVKYAFDMLQRECQQVSQGAAQDNLSWEKLSKITFPAPSIDVQRKVADIIFAYDDLIENNQKQIKLLEEAAQRLYKEWFVDLHFPGWEETKIVDGVPEGWEKKRVADLGKIITGKTPPTSKKEYYDGDIPFVTIPDMHNTVYPIHTERSLSNEGANSQKGKFIPVDSVMVSCIATVGLVNIALTDCQTNQQINSIILREKEMLYYTYCSMKRIKALLDGVGSNGATMTNVNKTKFESIEVVLPTKEIQKRFYDFCVPIFHSIKNLSFSIDNAKQARDRLLPKLMSGELEV